MSFWKRFIICWTMTATWADSTLPQPSLIDHNQECVTEITIEIIELIA